MQDLISKADVLLESLPYLQRFRGQHFVIKYGGSFMDSPDPAARERVVRDIVFLDAVGIKTIVVHGGGKAITRAMEAAGIKTNFVQGIRMTDKATVNIVEQVLSNEINPEIVKTIRALGGQARGFSGTDVFTCRKFRLDTSSGERMDIGFVGEVTAVNTRLLAECLRQNLMPVISPTGRSQDGHVYNCNADGAAAHAAIALNAGRLVFMSDVPGLLRDPQNPDSLIPRLRVEEVDPLKASGVIDKGMIPKVDGAVAALKAGVAKVSFVDGRVPHSILLDMFTDKGVGTEIVL
jgi:acetylglutamate kinase